MYYDSAPTLLLVLAQWGNTVLLVAVSSDSVPLVKMLLEDYGSTLDEVNKVSVTSNVEVLRFVMIHLFCTCTSM